MFTKNGSNLQIISTAVTSGLNKIASVIPEVQATVDKVVAKKDSDNFVYFWTRAVSADRENLNADIFPLDELKTAYPTFIGRGLYLDHNANSVANAVGKVFDAKLLEDPTAEDELDKYYVGCLCGVDKTTHPDIAAKVVHGIIDSVSMGASVAQAECSICHKVCSTPEDFCIHLQNQGQIDPETGKKCCSINRGVNFSELSLVSVPADPMAKMQQVFSGFVGNMKKKADAPKSSFLEKFSFSIPCGNEHICEMIFNILNSYKKKGIVDLSADGPILKLSVEAKSEEDALQKLENISKEQGLDVEKPLKNEENLMSKEEIKPVEKKAESDEISMKKLDWKGITDIEEQAKMLLKMTEQLSSVTEEGNYEVWLQNYSDGSSLEDLKEQLSDKEDPKYYEELGNLYDKLWEEQNKEFGFDKESAKGKKWSSKIKKETLKKIIKDGYTVKEGTPEYEECLNAGMSFTPDMFNEGLLVVNELINEKKSSSKKSKLSKKADNYGWSIDASEAFDKLQLWVDAVGEEKALEDLAQSLGTFQLTENLKYIFREYDIESDAKDIWDKLQVLIDTIGALEALDSLAKAIGNFKLAENLEYIFRMNDFREGLSVEESSRQIKDVLGKYMTKRESLNMSKKLAHIKRKADMDLSGIPGVEFVWNGSQADPEIKYNNHTFNYWDIEEALYEMYKEDGNTSDDGFNSFVKEQIKPLLDDYIGIGKESKKLSPKEMKEVVQMAGNLNGLSEDSKVNSLIDAALHLGIPEEKIRETFGDYMETPLGVAIPVKEAEAKPELPVDLKEDIKVEEPKEVKPEVKTEPKKDEKVEEPKKEGDSVNLSKKDVDEIIKAIKDVLKSEQEEASKGEDETKDIEGLNKVLDILGEGSKKEDKKETKEEPVEDKKEEPKKEESKKEETKEDIKPVFANVTRVSLLKTANLIDSKWVFHLKGTNKVACLSVKNLLPGVAEKVAYLTSQDFYNEMTNVLSNCQSMDAEAVKKITANFNEKIKVSSDETKSQVSKATNKVKVETDGKAVSNSGTATSTTMTDGGKAQKQDKVNSKEDAGSIEHASKKAPVETDIRVSAELDSKLKAITAALESKEAELQSMKLQRALEEKTAKARNIVTMSIKAGLVQCNEQFRQEELLKQSSPVKAKEEAMKRTADSMVKDLLGMSDEELDRQASYLSNFKVEAEVKQLKPIKIEASLEESQEENIIKALSDAMM